MSETASTSSSSSSSPAPSLGESLRRFGHWCVAHPLHALLFFAAIGALIYFYCGYKPFGKGSHSVWLWAYEAWNAENDLEHGVLILPGAIFVAWLQREAFTRAPKRGSWLGLVPLVLGITFFVIAARMLQPRISLIALPLIIGGAVWFLWGGTPSRIAFVPCLLLLFMVPAGFLLNHTQPLQQLVAVVVTAMSNLVGVGVDRQGVSLLARDGSFQCEVAGGCSGIRSIMAMTLLSLLYVHFNERTWWKKIVVFAMTLPFTVLGNIVRVFTIVLASKWFGQKVGTGPWHDISGFIVTIPIAVGAMIGFSELLNRDWSGMKRKLLTREQPSSPTKATEPTKEKSAASSPSSPISYDY